MADKIITSFLDQNPAETEPSNQEFLNKKRLLVEKILATYRDLLPSNYISEVTGPNYLNQFQAIAEQLAVIQITFQEILKDTQFDFTRSDFLYQFLGSLVFPEPDETGFPSIDGDITFRNFLEQMVLLLIEGAKLTTIEKGLELLTDADIQIIEKSIAARTTPNSIWGLDEQFEFEINVSSNGGTEFPDNPFLLQSNAFIVLRALKPAHTLYTYRHLFKEVFGALFEDTFTLDFTNHYYDDKRKYCDGAKSLTGGERLLFSTLGSGTLGSDLFEDLTVDFFASNIKSGNVLIISEGTSEGAYEIVQVQDSTHLLLNSTLPSTFSGVNWVVLNSSGGDTLSDQYLFSDPTRDFSSIKPFSLLKILSLAEGSSASVTAASSTFTDLSTNFISLGVISGDTLHISAGLNRGAYTVSSVVSETELTLTTLFASTEAGVSWFIKSPNTGDYKILDIISVPVPDDSTERTYTTYPTGLAGSLTVADGIFTDVSTIPVDFSTAVSGEILTIASGPNEGSYRLNIIPGGDGGFVGTTSVFSSEVIPSPSIVRVDRRMPVVAEGQSYSISVDRLGVQTPKKVCREDVSLFFVI